MKQKSDEQFITNQIANNDHSFNKWLLSREEWVEKTVGIVVLIVEVLILLGHLYHGISPLILTQLLNLLFLLFIYFYLSDDFRKRFTVNPDNKDVARILRFSDKANRKSNIIELVHYSNILLSQLKNVNYFILTTTGLYALFLLRVLAMKLYGSTHEEIVQYIFHVFIDLFSYIGAFFLLRCFYVMYLPTIDTKGQDVLKEKTKYYLFLGAFLMIFDVAIMFSYNGIFIAEFICGVINAIIFILFIARFENKILDIPPWILCLLYVYAILQTCLPFITTDSFGSELLKLPELVQSEKTVKIINEFKQFLEGFSRIILTLCLLGKITLSAVLLYVINSKRIFYYFMSLRKIHEEEEKNWIEFANLIKDATLRSDQFVITYFENENCRFTAKFVGFFDDVIGEGNSPDEARENLLANLKNDPQMK